MHQAQARQAMARKGIAYSRFSGKRQEAGESQERQDELAECAAREEGVELDRTITLRDKGVSAFRGDNWKRGDLGKFLDLVDSGVIPPGSVLIIEQVNRLSRMKWMAQVQLWKDILERGIVIRTCVPPSRYTRENMNELSVGCPVVIMMMLAHQDSQQKSDWVRHAWGTKKRKAAEEGTPHGRRCPRWVRAITAPHPKDPTRLVTLRYELNEERAAVVRQIYQWARDGWGAGRICNQLEKDDVAPWNGRCWCVSSVTWILQARETYGEYQRMRCGDDGKDVPDGPPVPSYYPKVVPEEVWLATQAARSRRRKRGGRPGKVVETNRRKRGGRPGKVVVETNLFTHLAFEAVSRRPLQVHSRTNHGRVYYYLNTDPERESIPYQPFQQAVLDAVASLKPRDVDGRHEADTLTAKVDALGQEREELGLALDALDGKIRLLPLARWPKRVVARMAELEELIEAKDEELRAAKEAANTSSRTEALTAIQTCVKLLDDIRKEGDVEREAAVRARIKTRLPLLLDSIWVRVQRIDKARRYVHVRLYLHGGGQRYFPVPCGDVEGVPPWRLKDADFRAGDVGRDAVGAKAAAQFSA